MDAFAECVIADGGDGIGDGHRSQVAVGKRILVDLGHASRNFDVRLIPFVGHKPDVGPIVTCDETVCVPAQLGIAFVDYNLLGIIGDVTIVFGASFDG